MAGIEEQVRAEIQSVIETAGNVAHGGLEPGSDGPRVLAGLLLKLAEQVERLAHARSAGSSAPSGRSPNENEAPIEEDITPEDAPAQPARGV